MTRQTDREILAYFVVYEQPQALEALYTGGDPPDIDMDAVVAAFREEHGRDLLVEPMGRGFFQVVSVDVELLSSLPMNFREFGRERTPHTIFGRKPDERVREFGKPASQLARIRLLEVAGRLADALDVMDTDLTGVHVLHLEQSIIFHVPTRQMQHQAMLVFKLFRVPVKRLSAGDDFAVTVGGAEVNVVVGP